MRYDATIVKNNLPRRTKARRYFFAVIRGVGLRCAIPTYKSVWRPGAGWNKFLTIKDHRF
jgi:hypothetical protein